MSILLKKLIVILCSLMVVAGIFLFLLLGLRVTTAKAETIDESNTSDTVMPIAGSTNETSPEIPSEDFVEDDSGNDTTVIYFFPSATRSSDGTLIGSSVCRNSDEEYDEEDDTKNNEDSSVNTTDENDSTKHTDNEESDTQSTESVVEEDTETDDSTNKAVTPDVSSSTSTKSNDAKKQAEDVPEVESKVDNTTPEIATSTPIATMYTVSSANARIAPYTSSAVYYAYSPGAAVSVLEHGTYWTKVEVNGYECYVYTPLLTWSPEYTTDTTN